MVNYYCPRCGYETSHFVTFKRHLSRKKICENTVSDDNLNDLYIKYNINEKVININSTQNTTKIPQNPTIYHNLPQFTTQMTHNDSQIIFDDSNKFKYECKYCLKKLSRKDSLDRHLKKCKLKENEKEESDEKQSLLEIVSQLNKKLDKKEKQIDELIKKTGNTTNNITYQQNNVSNNIKLLGYRNTDISHLSDKDFISCISHSNFCIPHLIKKIHFDPEKPENHNIYISNIKNNYAMTYDGDKWNLSNRDDLINDILEEKEIIIEEKLEEWLEKGKMYPEIMKKFTRYLEKKENDVVLDKIKDEIKLVLFNNRNLIKN